MNFALNRSHFVYPLLTLLLIIFFVTDVCYGTVYIPFSEIWQIMAGIEVSHGNKFIILDFRLPKALTALFAGAALSVSGLVMQTFFRNALAGPYVYWLWPEVFLAGFCSLDNGELSLPACLDQVLSLPWSWRRPRE